MTCCQVDELVRVTGVTYHHHEVGYDIENALGEGETGDCQWDGVISWEQNVRVLVHAF
jgi:hypothetical protein